MSRRLNDLTPKERKTMLVAGARLSYADMKNPRTKYTITEIFTDGLGKHAKLLSDEGEADTIYIDAGFQHGWRLEE